MSEIDAKLVDKLLELADAARAAIVFAQERSLGRDSAGSHEWERLTDAVRLSIKLVTEFGAAVQALYPEAELPEAPREVDFRGTQVELSYQDDRQLDRSTRVVGFTPNRGDLR